MPPFHQHATFALKIGQPKITTNKLLAGNVPVQLMDAIAEIVVDSALHLPDMVTIRVNDPQLQWLDDNTLFNFGNEVIVEAQAQEQHGGAQGALFQGEITALEPEYDAQSVTTFVVRGYAKTNRLHLGRHSRTFTNQSDSDIVRTIAQEVGLTPEVDKTEVKYAYVLQQNQTNMEFLTVRAERIGYQVYTSGDKLYFKKSDAERSAAVTLKFGDALRSFRPRATMAHQATKVQVRSWDGERKIAIKGEAQLNAKLNQATLGKTGGEQVRAALHMDAPTVIVDTPVTSVEEANALAQGLANDLSRSFVEAEGVSFGNPQLKAGMVVTLTGLGQRFSGNYFVTTARHVYSAAGYHVAFTVSGRQPQTIQQLLTGRNQAARQRQGRVQGVVIGLVTNLNDPENIGRVKVKFPWMADDAGVEIESAWAKVVAPMAGKERGFFCLPEIDDEVLVAFEHGDVNRPYIVGALWSKRDQPPVSQNTAVQGGRVMQRLLRTRAGHEILLDDTDGKAKLVVRSQGKHLIELNDATGQQTVTVRTAGGQSVKLQDAPTPQITVADQSGQNTLVIDGATQSVMLKAAMNLTLQAGGMLNLVGQMGLSLSSPAGGTMQSAGPIAIKSVAGVSIDGGAMAELKGAIVKIN